MDSNKSILPLVTVPIFYQCIEPLKLYVEQQAWWNSCPQTKGAKEYNRTTRLKSFQQKNPNESALMPLLECGHYLIDLLHNAGTVTYNDGIAKRLSWSELKAWCDLTGLRLCPFESATIMMLSAAYADMLNEATDPNCPSPMLPKMTQSKREQVATDLKSALRSIGKKR